jgi:hypothetical protein
MKDANDNVRKEIMWAVAMLEDAVKKEAEAARITITRNPKGPISGTARGARSALDELVAGSCEQCDHPTTVQSEVTERGVDALVAVAHLILARAPRGAEFPIPTWGSESSLE